MEIETQDMNSKTALPVILIYKRTHKGDPDERGIFGIHDCMGRVKDWKFDAVIGIGGKRPDKGNESIAFKINWIGIGQKKFQCKPKHRGQYVCFEHFLLKEDQGEFIKKWEALYEFMYEGKRRIVLSHLFPEDVYSNAREILKLAENCPPSQAYQAAGEVPDKCK